MNLSCGYTDSRAGTGSEHCINWIAFQVLTNSANKPSAVQTHAVRWLETGWLCRLFLAFPGGPVGAAVGLRAPVALASSSSPQVRRRPGRLPLSSLPQRLTLERGQLDGRSGGRRRRRRPLGRTREPAGRAAAERSGSAANGKLLFPRRSKWLAAAYQPPRCGFSAPKTTLTERASVAW